MCNVLAVLGGIVFFLCILSILFGSGDFAKFIGREMVGIEHTKSEEEIERQINEAVQKALDERSKTRK